MINENECCGCEACESVCPKKAISIIQNSKGFFAAKVDKKLCVNCQLCDKVCPMVTLNKNPCINLVYAIVNKDSQIVLNSSSGGVFDVLSRAVINEGGVVSGVEWDDKLNAIHTITESNEHISMYHGSKYVQSRNQIYVEIKRYLEEGKTVLYSGTPCQVAAVKNYLSSVKPGKLITVEVLCHGVGSPAIFHEHISSFSEHMVDFNFRNKERINPTIAYIFKNHKKLMDFNLDNYANGFNRCILLNDVCFSCKYAGDKRAGDITIGDFWKGPTTRDIVGTELSDQFPKGVSLLTVNSDQGKVLFEMIKDKVFYITSSLQIAQKGNRTLVAPSPKNKLYILFWKLYKLFGWKVTKNILCVSPIYRLKYSFNRIRKSYEK